MSVNLEQLLPQDNYDALVASVSSPSGVNAYATIADLTGFVTGNLYTTDGAIPAATTRAVTIAADSIVRFAGGTTVHTMTSGGSTITSGTGTNPIGFGIFGSLDLLNSTGAFDSYSGNFASGANPVVESQIYDNTTFLEKSGHFLGVKNLGGTDRPYSSMYYSPDGVGLVGFEANENGERVLSESAGLNRLTTLDAAAGMAFLSGSGGTGYIGVVDQAGLIDWMGLLWPTVPDTLYTASGTTQSNTDVTVTDELTFLTPGLGRVLIGPTAFTGLNNFHHRSSNGNGAHFDGNNNSPSGYIAKFRNFDGVSTYTDVVRFRGSGRIDLAPTVGFVNIGAITGGGSLNVEDTIFIDTVGAGTDSRLTFRTLGTSRATIGVDESDGNKLKIGTTAITTATLATLDLANGNFIIGTNTAVGGGRFHVRGIGNTSATRLVTFEGLAGNDRFVINDDGQSATGIGTSALTNPSFGQINRSLNYAFGWGFYPNNATSAGVTVQMQGTTRTGFSVATQNAPSGGTVKGIDVNLAAAVNSTLNIGVNSLARSGSQFSIGVVGNASETNALFTPSIASIGVQGNTAGTAQSALQVGVQGNAQFNNSALQWTTDLIGVEGVGVGQNGLATSTSNIIGMRARTTGINSTGDFIALLVPSTNNNGTVVFGADNVTNGSMLEVTGDIEVIGAGGTEGVILEAPDTTRYRVTVNNLGALVIAAA